VSVPTLIYDGECPICQRAKAWVAARSAPGAIRFVTCQSDEREAAAPGLALDDCMEAMRFVSADGQVHTGHAAFPPLLRMLPRYRWLAMFLDLPGVRHLAPFVYARVARNRYALSGLLKTRKDGESCSIDSGCR